MKKNNMFIFVVIGLIALLVVSKQMNLFTVVYSGPACQETTSTQFVKYFTVQASSNNCPLSSFTTTSSTPVTWSAVWSSNAGSTACGQDQPSGSGSGTVSITSSTTTSATIQITVPSQYCSGSSVLGYLKVTGVYKSIDICSNPTGQQGSMYCTGATTQSYKICNAGQWILSGCGAGKECQGTIGAIGATCVNIVTGCTNPTGQNNWFGCSDVHTQTECVDGAWKYAKTCGTCCWMPNTGPNGETAGQGFCSPYENAICNSPWVKGGSATGCTNPTANVGQWKCLNSFTYECVSTNWYQWADCAGMGKICCLEADKSNAWCASTCETPSCPSGHTLCSDGICRISCTSGTKTCEKDYVGKCGTFDDGSGKTLICTCPTDKTCTNNVCTIPNQVTCNKNTICETGETHNNCPEDCATCGDSICESSLGETSSSCIVDCPAAVCGNGLCESGESCTEDCPVPFDCTKPNNVCPSGTKCDTLGKCVADTIIPTTFDCRSPKLDKCPISTVCNQLTGKCGTLSVTCNKNGVCDTGEDILNCADDCMASGPPYMLIFIGFVIVGAVIIFSRKRSY